MDRTVMRTTGGQVGGGDYRVHNRIRDIWVLVAERSNLYNGLGQNQKV